MNCDTCQQELPFKMRGQLNPALEAELTTHLAACQHCTTWQKEMQSIYQILDQDVPLTRAMQLRTPKLAATAANSDSVHRGLRAISAFLSALWGSHPFAAGGYSMLLLVCGLVTGQLLPPDTLGLHPASLAQSTQGISTDRLIQLCSVPPAPADAFL